MRITLVGILCWAVTGCVPPQLALPQTDEPIPAGMGQLKLSWVSESASKALLGSAWASQTADVYELLALGSGQTYHFDVGNASDHTVALVPGDYRVLLLAGVKRSSGSITAELIGSALAEGVTVVEGVRTPVDLILRSIDLSISYQQTPTWQSSLTVQASGASRNQRLGMFLFGTSTTERPRFKSTDLWSGYEDCSTVSGTSDEWSCEATGTVPDASATVTVGLVGATVCYQDATDTWTTTYKLTKYSWTWPNRADLTDTHVLTPRTEVVATAVPPPTGADITIAWE